MHDRLLVPTFARIDEYFGIWAIEPMRMDSLRETARTLDWSDHMRAASGPVRSGMSQQKVDGKNVAVIQLSGLLMKGTSSMGGTSTIQARRDIRNAVSDPNVDAICLAIDSPGGTVSGTSDLADEVKAARAVKPVVAHVEDLCASAAYWVASQCESITSNSPTAFIGSIGTVQVVYDHSAAAEKAGIKAMVFSTGPLKGLGTPGTAVTEEQQRHLQALVDGVQQSFDNAVQSGRKLSRPELAAVRHGGVFTAADAKDRRLIDGIQPLGATLSKLASGRQMPRAIPMVKMGTLPMRS